METKLDIEAELDRYCLICVNERQVYDFDSDYKGSYRKHKAPICLKCAAKIAKKYEKMQQSHKRAKTRGQRLQKLVNTVSGREAPAGN